MSTVTPSSPLDEPTTGEGPLPLGDAFEDSAEATLEATVGEAIHGSIHDKAVNPPPAEPAGPGTGTAAWDPLTALTAGTAEPAARFRYDVRTGDWWWSPGMFDLHGLTEGEVEPTTELLMAHKHPEDLASTEQTLRSVLATGEPFCCRHRVVDTHGRTREVLSVGQAVCDPDGRVASVQGYFVDLTAAFAGAVEQAASDLLAVEPRRLPVDPVVEQAKGVLIGAFRLTAGAALELLTWRSEEARIDLAVVSRGLVEEFQALHEDDLSPARRACAYLGLTALDDD